MIENFLKKHIFKIGVVATSFLTFANFAGATATYTFINWTDGMTADFLANITGLITDLSPLLVPVIAIAVGLIIVEAIISAIRGHK